jgi:hypothetical protein
MKQFCLSCFLLVFPLLFSLSLSAQSTWYKDLPGTDFGSECIATYDGGVVAVTFLEHKIIKLDANGDLQWAFVIDTNALQYLTKVIETEDHGIVAVGSQSNWTATLVWKLDENGNLLWHRRYDPTVGQGLTAHWVCPAHGDGGFLIGGGECAMQFYVIRCDANGDILWQKQYFGLTSAPTGYFPTMVQAGSSGYFLTISRLESGDFDWGILKIDDLGNPLWAKATDEGSERDEVEAACPTAAGGMAVAGITTNYQAPNNQYKMTLTVFDSSGNRTTYKVYDYTEQLQPHDIAQLGDGGYVMTGSTVSLNTMLVKTDWNGAIQWQKTSTGNVTQEGYGVADAGGGMFFLSAHDFNHKATLAKLSGLTGQGICTEGSIQLTSASYQPTVIPLIPSTAPGTAATTLINYPHHTETTEATTVCAMTGDVEALEGVGMGASPNPFVDGLRVDFGGVLEEGGILRLMDVRGRVVAETDIMAGVQYYDWAVPQLADGIYLLKLEAGGNSHTVKVLKQGN